MGDLPSVLDVAEMCENNQDDIARVTDKLNQLVRLLSREYLLYIKESHDNLRSMRKDLSNIKEYCSGFDCPLRPKPTTPPWWFHNIFK